MDDDMPEGWQPWYFENVGYRDGDTWASAVYERCCKGKSMEASRRVENKGEIQPNLRLEGE